MRELKYATQSMIDHRKRALEEWIAKKLSEASASALDTNLITGMGTSNSWTEKPGANKLRMDARLVQILRGVRSGVIAVEDAALEIIEGRELDRRSFLAPAAGEAALTLDALLKAKEMLLTLHPTEERIQGVWPDKLLGLPAVVREDLPEGTVALVNNYRVELTPAARIQIVGEAKS